MEFDFTWNGKIAPPSMGSLFLRFKFGDTQLASGTGFLVQSHTGFALVTARHNLTGRHHDTNECLHARAGVPDTVDIYHNARLPGLNVIKSQRILDGDGARRWIEHPKLGDLCDVALLPLDDLSEIVVASYTWQNGYPDIAVKVSEPVSVIGFPMGQSAGGMLGIWCTGYIASEPLLDYGGQPKFLIDCRTRAGQSGSPVIAYRNGAYTQQDGWLFAGSGYAMRPLGVYTGRIHPDADIGVVWKWSVVEDLMYEADKTFADSLRAKTAP